MKNFNYFKQLDKVIQEFEPKAEEAPEDKIECEHDVIAIDGFKTCQKCGVVLCQIFKTVSNDGFEFLENKERRKNKYSQINEIKSKFLNYVMHSQKKISDVDYEKFMLSWNNKNKLNRKNIMKCIIDNNLDKADLNMFYNSLKHGENKQSNSILLNNEKINQIFAVCQKFIKFYKGIIKNINKRALIYTICKNKYNIILDDYVGHMKQALLIKYDNYYLEFAK